MVAKRIENLTPTPTGEDSRLILAELRQLREMFRQRIAPPPTIMVDSVEAARMLSVCVRTLQTWTSDGLLARVVVGGVHRYRVADLEAFAAERARIAEP